MAPRSRPNTENPRFYLLVCPPLVPPPRISALRVFGEVFDIGGSPLRRYPGPFVVRIANR